MLEDRVAMFSLYLRLMVTLYMQRTLLSPAYASFSRSCHAKPPWVLRKKYCDLLSSGDHITRIFEQICMDWAKPYLIENVSILPKTQSAIKLSNIHPAVMMAPKTQCGLGYLEYLLLIGVAFLDA